MLTNNYIDINQVISRIYDDPNMANCPEDFIITHISDVVEICGVPQSLMQKEVILDVKNFKAKLPCDFMEMIQICLTNGTELFPMRYSTSSFNPDRDSAITYKIQGGVLITSLDNVQVKLSYMAFPVDSNGYPLIINNKAFIRAIEFYVRWQWYIIECGRGVININMMTYLEGVYNSSIATAETNMRTPTIDQAESISRMFNSILEQRYSHDNTFNDINIGTEPKIK